jgi:hypothetical protein
MNSNLDADKNRNSYQGNGWSNYQIMVLQQLEDHNEVLHNLNKEIVDIKQTMAVSDTEIKMWRTSAMADLEQLRKQMSVLLYEDGGLSKKIERMERDRDLKDDRLTRSKAFWASLGCLFTVIIDIIIKIGLWLKP